MALGLYKRLSVYDGTSTSPERQEADGRNFADLHGEEVVKTYSDLDLSAYTGVDRPAFEELLADAEAGVIDGILVWRLDRLTRNFDDLQRLWKLINGRGYGSYRSMTASTPLRLVGCSCSGP